MQTYKSKLDKKLCIPIALVIGTVLFIMVYNKIWIGVLIILLVISFVVHMFLTTRYHVIGKKLVIKCGFLYNATVNIDAIKSIKETNNPMSSPATSLDRLEISYRYGAVLISPKKKEAFIKQLMEINPAIEVKRKAQQRA